jgi:hypothetical protein
MQQHHYGMIQHGTGHNPDGQSAIIGHQLQQLIKLQPHQQHTSAGLPLHQQQVINTQQVPKKL